MEKIITPHDCPGYIPRVEGKFFKARIDGKEQVVKLLKIVDNRLYVEVSEETNEI